MQSNSGSMMEHSTGLQSGSQSGLPSLSEAREAGERGMTLALEKACREHPEWKTRAYEFLKSYAAREPRFAAFMVVASSRTDKAFPQPTNEKSWGAIFRKAGNNGVIRKTTQRIPHPQRHGCPADVWESLICEQSAVRAA